MIFLSEAFTRPKMMKVLAKVGFTQSYTYFTWRDEKQELIAYFTEITQPPVASSLLWGARAEFEPLMDMISAAKISARPITGRRTLSTSISIEAGLAAPSPEIAGW